MKYNYQYKITFGLNKPFDINYIKNICNQYPNAKILVEVKNTNGMSSTMVRQLSSNVAIRIAGGFDEKRCKNGHQQGNGYVESVTYTKNETVKILEEIEKIETGTNKNWTDIQKIIYIYDRLKTGIMYDPKYEHKLSSEIRSLRGLITRQTVCVGYSLIFKEFMDRNDIDCEYTEGFTRYNRDGKQVGHHAWNIININGKKYPIDLTWDNTKFRAGKSSTFEYLGQDISKFIQSHHPYTIEKTQDYKHTLSQINPQVVKQIYSQMGVWRSRDYRSTTYYASRKDGSRYIVAQIGDATINNINYYRYYYAEISKDGKKQLPLILYSDTNVTHLIDCKNFGKPIPPNYEETVSDILFSKENIADSIAKKTYYIGKVRRNEVGNKFELVSSYQEIPKLEDKRNLFVYPTRRYTRSDGSVFIAQQMLKSPHKVNGIDVMRYDIFEIVYENGEEVLKRNTVFTERNFFNDNRQDMVDDYLSRERLDRKVAEAGGYIGYYDSNGVRTYNPDLVKYFETSKRIDIDSLNKQKHKNVTPKTSIPTFEELKSIASKYEIYFDPNDLFDQDTFKIRDIKTGQIQTDQSIIDKAMFANIWLASAGVKYSQGDSRPGAKYAFNKPAEELYNTICDQLIESCKSKGVIDTVDLLRNFENNNNNYKYNSEIIVHLFKTPYQTEMINKLFLQSIGVNSQTKAPEPLYTMSYAGELAFGSQSSHTK